MFFKAFFFHFVLIYGNFSCALYFVLQCTTALTSVATVLSAFSEVLFSLIGRFLRIYVGCSSLVWDLL